MMSRRPRQAPSAEDFTMSFRRFDRNNDHRLNLDEFREAVHFLGFAVSVKNLRDSFEQADFDQRGHIDYTQFEYAIYSQLPQLDACWTPLLSGTSDGRIADESEDLPSSAAYIFSSNMSPDRPRQDLQTLLEKSRKILSLRGKMDLLFDMTAEMHRMSRGSDFRTGFLACLEFFVESIRSQQAILSREACKCVAILAKQYPKHFVRVSIQIIKSLIHTLKNKHDKLIRVSGQFALLVISHFVSDTAEFTLTKMLSRAAQSSSHVNVRTNAYRYLSILACRTDTPHITESAVFWDELKQCIKVGIDSSHREVQAACQECFHAVEDKFRELKPRNDSELFTPRTTSKLNKDVLIPGARNDASRKSVGGRPGEKSQRSSDSSVREPNTYFDGGIAEDAETHPKHSLQVDVKQEFKQPVKSKLTTRSLHSPVHRSINNAKRPDANRLKRLGMSQSQTTPAQVRPANAVGAPVDDDDAETDSSLSDMADDSISVFSERRDEKTSEQEGHDSDDCSVFADQIFNTGMLFEIMGQSSIEVTKEMDRQSDFVISLGTPVFVTAQEIQSNRLRISYPCLGWLNLNSSCRCIKPQEIQSDSSLCERVLTHLFQTQDSAGMAKTQLMRETKETDQLRRELQSAQDEVQQYERQLKTERTLRVQWHEESQRNESSAQEWEQKYQEIVAEIPAFRKAQKLVKRMEKQWEVLDHVEGTNNVMTQYEANTLRMSFEARKALQAVEERLMRRLMDCEERIRSKVVTFDTLANFCEEEVVEEIKNSEGTIKQKFSAVLS